MQQQNKVNLEMKFEKLQKQEKKYTLEAHKKDLNCT